MAQPAAQRDTTKAAKRGALPLEPTNQFLEFKTTEGTWISLDVTPDGASVVFELLGDLYSLPIAGGTAKRITEGMGYDTQPKVSPDGKWIAFSGEYDGNVDVFFTAVGPNWFFRNEGGRFVNATDEAGLAGRDGKFDPFRSCSTR